MTPRHFLAGTVAGLALFSACSQAAPPATQPVASLPATSAPADGGGAAADDVIGRIAAAQSNVKTYTIDMSMDTAVTGEVATIAMTGTVDQTDKSNVKMAMDTDVAGMKMKMILADGEMFLQMDAAGDTWMRVPKDQMSEYESTTQSTDITAKLQEVKDSVKQVESVGEETIDGVKTSHHRLTIDGSALSKMTGADGTIEADTFTYDLWLDDADMVRMVSIDLDARIDGKSVPLKIDAKMGHFNEAVNIKAPAKDKIVDMGS